MCLLGMLGLITPRLILVLLWVFSPDVIIGPFSGLPIPNPIVPLLGLVFLPTTTLGFCWANVSFGGLQTFSGLVIVLTGLLIDAGLIGKGRGITGR